MQEIIETTYISEIIEKSKETPVIIFKYSNTCGSSEKLKEDIISAIENKKILNPVFLITVQTMPNLSSKIENWFQIKHESPQIIILNSGNVTYTQHHENINIDKFTYN